MQSRLVRKSPFGLLAMMALFAGSCAPARPAPLCKGPLSGRTITLSPDVGKFGSVQGGQPLMQLAAGEYVLSFDDGPHLMSTQTLVDTLDQNCIHAMFMNVGKNAQAHPELTRIIVEHGETLGSHSFDHANFSTMTAPQWQADMVQGADAVEMVASGHARGNAWRFARIPGATGMPQVARPEWVSFLNAHHLVLAGYDASGDDWKNGPPDASFRILMGRLKDRGVIVMHEGQSNTPAFLKMVLAELQRRGAKVVTLRLADH